MNGLYQKYVVYRYDNGDEVEGCFVLKPETDSHARYAIDQYAISIQNENPQLAEDLWDWLTRLIDPNAEVE